MYINRKYWNIQTLMPTRVRIAQWRGINRDWVGEWNIERLLATLKWWPTHTRVTQSWPVATRHDAKVVRDAIAAAWFHPIETAIGQGLRPHFSSLLDIGNGMERLLYSSRAAGHDEVDVSCFVAISRRMSSEIWHSGAGAERTGPGKCSWSTIGRTTSWSRCADRENPWHSSAVSWNSKGNHFKAAGIRSEPEN